RQITADGVTHALPAPFFVVATQNPTWQIGTFPLPESQLDRFLMRITLGYPAPGLERRLLTGRDRRELLHDFSPAIDPAIAPETLRSLQDHVTRVHFAPALLDYVQAVVSFTRESSTFEAGLSPRAAIALLRAAQAWAFISGHRGGVLPEDVQAVLPGIVGHRLKARGDAGPQRADDVGRFVIESVPVP
ncbi:MAG: AAA family ATPase, partial [Gammaproteobacteria bacterium]